MQNAKLLQLFKAIREAELREFTQFLKSPFYNRNQRVIALYEYLRKQKKNLEDEKFTKEYVFKRIFPKGEKYEDWKMRELMSDLSKLIEEYFIVKEAKRNEIERQMLLIKSHNCNFTNCYTTILPPLTMPTKEVVNYYLVSCIIRTCFTALQNLSTATK